MMSQPAHTEPLAHLSDTQRDYILDLAVREYASGKPVRFKFNGFSLQEVLRTFEGDNRPAQALGDLLGIDLTASRRAIARTLAARLGLALDPPPVDPFAA